MAGWTTLPVTGGLVSAVTKENFNEVRAAAVERGNTGIDAVASDSDAIALARSWLTNARTQIENMLTGFANPDVEYLPYNKTTCLTAALGKADWKEADPTDLKLAEEINELRLVLNQLSWRRYNPDVSRQVLSNGTSLPFGGEQISAGSSDTSWDEAWTNCLNDMLAGSWATPSPFPGRPVGLWAKSYSPSYFWKDGPVSATYGKAMFRARYRDLVFSPSAETVLAAKMSFQDPIERRGSVYQDSTDTTINIYEEADFGGTPIEVSLAADPIGELFVKNVGVSLPIAGHFSISAEPPMMTDWSPYRPPDVDGQEKGMYVDGVAGIIGPFLLVHHQYEYRSA